MPMPLSQRPRNYRRPPGPKPRATLAVATSLGPLWRVADDRARAQPRADPPIRARPPGRAHAATVAPGPVMHTLRRTCSGGSTSRRSSRTPVTRSARAAQASRSRNIVPATGPPSGVGTACGERRGCPRRPGMDRGCATLDGRSGASMHRCRAARPARHCLQSALACAFVLARAPALPPPLPSLPRERLHPCPWCVGGSPRSTRLTARGACLAARHG